MMYGDTSCPCIGCTTRTAECHGHKPDGSWRCPRWAAYQEKVPERERVKKAACTYSDYHREAVQRSVRIKKKGR